MQVELGAKVSTADGKQLGTIDKLILEPESGEVKSIVVHKGLLFGRDIEIAIGEIVGRERGTVRVAYTSRQVDDLPPFLEGSYTTPPPGRVSEYEAAYGYPSATFLWPARGAGAPAPSAYGDEAVGEVGDEVRALHGEQDQANAIVEVGSEVRAGDGEKVGTVHSIAFDPSDGRPLSIVVRKGFLFTEDVELPASLFASADDGVIYLDVRSDEVKRHLGRQKVHPPVI
jgi:uncharacterized protein YrrD